MATKYIRTSKASKDSDVYSFRAVELEIACGRSIKDQTGELSEIFLVDWVWEAYGRKTLHDVDDKKLCKNFDQNQVETLMTLPPKTPVANYVVPNVPTARSSSWRSSMSLKL
ncbi:hypothetical protein Ddye_014097 [Dipteronia dyeriana]|uniref:Uncharacterized protein n=1 Tax=Dipteronia dyeriana TaxID=168575 RepID=A0AAD9X7C1_9ROSI|nr:hypothetical protein Ddye_014097 [Dipteronia dyeriana]